MCVGGGGGGGCVHVCVRGDCARMFVHVHTYRCAHVCKSVSAHTHTFVPAYMHTPKTKSDKVD